MNKKEFISRWSELSGLPNNKLEELLKTFVYIIGDVLVSSDKITLPGLGTFSIKERPERMARNPLTGNVVKVVAKNVVKFKVGKQLDEKLNEVKDVNLLKIKDNDGSKKKTTKSVKK